MELLQDKGRDYRRFRFSPREQAFLSLNGFQTVQSSNVAAIGVKGEDLLIRFHNGSVYAYRNRANDYDKILASNSKGKWVWRFLRRTNAFYNKLGVIPLPDDIGVTDEEIFQEIDNRYLADLTRHVDVPVFQSFEFIGGMNYQKIIVGDFSVYKAITAPLAPAPTISVEPSQTIDIKKPLAFDVTKTASQTFDVFNDTVKDIKTPYNTVKNVLAKSNIIFDTGKPIKVKLSTQGGMSIKPSRSNPEITVPNLNNKSSLYGVETFTHEYSHMVDFKVMDYLGKKDGVYYGSSASFSGLGLKNKRPDTPLLGQAYDISKQLTNAVIDQLKQVDKDPKEYMSNRTQGVKNIIATIKENQMNIINEMNDNIDKVQADYTNGKITFDEAKKQRDKLVADSLQTTNTTLYNEGAVVDIYDAITSGYMQTNEKIGGHGVAYYKFDMNASENKLNEIYANLTELSIHKPEYIEVLRQDIPDIVSSWENINNFIDEVVDGFI